VSANGKTEPAAGVLWTVGNHPNVEIGVSQEGEEYELANVASAHNVLGHYLIAENRPSRISVFDFRGQYVRSIGGVGAGPGEFQSISGIFLAPPDTVIVYDGALRRITHFALDGRVLQTDQYDAGGSSRVGDVRPRYLVGRFADGSFLTRPEFVEPRDDAPRDRVTATPVPFLREELTSGTVDTAAVVLGQERVFRAWPGTGSGYWQSVPFSPSAVAATFDTFLFVSDKRSYTVEMRTMRGVFVDSLGRAWEVSPLTDVVWNAELQRRLDVLRRRVETSSGPKLDLQAESAAIRRQFRNEERLDVLPAHGSGMLVDPGGNLWVQEWGGDPRHGAQEWDVFAAGGDGTSQRITMPEGFRPTAVYASSIVGVYTGAFDVETVREYSLTRR